jgi:hypothetical protein
LLNLEQSLDNLLFTNATGKHIERSGILMIRVRTLALINFCLLLTSCSSNTSSPDHAVQPNTKQSVAKVSDPWQEWQIRSQSERVSASLFPQAVHVKAYAGQIAISVDGAGEVKQSRLKDKNGDLVKTDPIGGASLTKDEIAILRKSIFYAPEPPAVAACCVPRHIFTFFDENYHFVGSLEVCFQCGCALISNSQPPDPHLSFLIWDKTTIGNIFLNHGIPVTIPVSFLN